ncbi:hypothetical protein ACFQER_15450 [Halomicroarcula sp. GCM10025894]|uniref:DUF7286 family protein n=1 Tax=Halomicroarcula sp. GCM10025894 TaxID=3252673 RepID=UPI00360B663D
MASTVFQVHERTQTYEDRLEMGFFEPGFSGDERFRGFGRKFAIRAYPNAYARTYFDRAPKPGSWDRAFPTVNENRHTEILANDAIYSVQESTFGTKDPMSDRVMNGRWMCFGYSTLHSVQQAYTGDNPDEDANSRGDNLTDEDDIDSETENALSEELGTSAEELFSDDNICGLSWTFFGNADGSFPSAPTVQEMTSDILTSNSDTLSQEETVTVEPFAQAAYYEVSGYSDVANEVEEEMSISGDQEPDNYEDRFGDNDTSEEQDSVSDLTGPDGEDLDFEEKIDETIDEVYSVDVSATDNGGATRSGTSPSAPSPGSEWEAVDTDETITNNEVTVDVDRGPTETTSQESDVYDVDVTVDNNVHVETDWEKEVEVPCEDENETGCTETKDKTTEDDSDIEYSVSIDVTADHSTDTDIRSRGIENAYESGGDGPAGTNNFGNVHEDAADQVFGASGPSESDVESAIRSSITATDVESTSEMENQVGYSTDVDVSVSPNDRAELEDWLEDELAETRQDVIDEEYAVTQSRLDMVTSDEPLAEMKTDLRGDRDDYVTEDVDSRYDSAPGKARAQLRNDYIDKTIEWAEYTESQQQEATGKVDDAIDSSIGDEVEGVDSALDESLGLAQDILNGGVDTEPGELEGSPELGDVTYEVDGSPTYLSRTSVSASEAPAVRRSDAGPMDSEARDAHAPLGAKYDNIILPWPGLPITPWPPGYWIMTLSSWNVQVDGEYARFEVRAETGDASTTGSTTYVRDDRPVELDIEDDKREVGRVKPINFESSTIVVAVVPSKLRMPRGKLGVGDRGSASRGGWWDCSDTWGAVGPEYDGGDGSCNYILDD